MDQFQPIDVTNSSLGAQLFPSEEVYLLTPGVGLYSGTSKSLPHASGTVYLTSHRLFYIDDVEPHRHSCFIRLSSIRETQYYAGFLKSSPKVTIGFKTVESAKSNVHPEDQGRDTKGDAHTASAAPSGQDWRLAAQAADASATALPTRSWICRVCAFNNPLDPGVSSDTSVKCSLCGVATDFRDLSLTQMQSPPARPAAAIANAILATINDKPSKDLSCPVCTFHNHPSMLRCEICDSPLVTASLKESVTATAAQLTKRPEAEAGRVGAAEVPDSVRLSFRKGGDKAFYDLLKATLKEKRWHRGANDSNIHVANGQRASSGSRTARDRRFRGGMGSNIDGRSARTASDDEWSANGLSATPSTRGVGIDGILSAVDLQSRVENDGMRDALHDLEALMTRAKKMVDLAESLNAKLLKAETIRTNADGTATAVVGGEDQEAANMIRSSMLRLGLPTPAITPDMARDELEYNTQLARELGGLLYAAGRPLMGRGKVLSVPADTLLQHTTSDGTLHQYQAGCGILALDEVWCLWNRARGVALVSPKVLLNVLPLLSRLTVPPITCKTLSSGLKIIYTPQFATVNFNARICALLDAKAAEVRARSVGDDDESTLSNAAGITTLELATIEACPITLMAELLADVEMEIGELVRDSHAGQVTWYRNLFSTAGAL